MAESVDLGYLFGFEIGNFIFFTLFGALLMKLILKIGFKNYEIGWKDAFRLSLYTFGLVTAISLVINFLIGALIGFLQPVFVVVNIILISAAIFIAKRFLTKIGMKDKIWLFSTIWVIGTYVVAGILSIIGSA